ncbi:MAG: DUF4838 domain-containing protein, partial [Kiritimatiellia bacterium]
EQAIWVGYQPKLKELFPEIDFDFQHPEEILIACDGKHLVIAGRDRWDPDNLIIDRDVGKPQAIQFEYGTVNAVYTFLQDYLGVRWLWPGELGEDIVEQSTIDFEPFEYRYHPQIRYRGGLFNIMARQHRLGRGGDWLRLQRGALGSLEMNAGGHGFGSWWDRFHEEHPEYFAMQPDGKRSGFPEGNAKMCHSNPGLADQWIEEVARQLEEEPLQRVFNASPNDSGARGHCVCENCRAWDHPDAETLIFTWQGLSQEYVAISDRQVKFANIVARKLREKYPDKDYYVSLMAYGNWRPAPVAEKPDDNVIIVNVANYFWNVDTPTARGANNPAAQQYADWGKMANRQVWRPNTGDPAGWQKGLPDVPFGRRAEAFQFAATNNCVGIFVDMVWNHWATQGPIYYLMAQLAWNPFDDWQAIMDDYYRRAFGPAAAELKDYWELMEEARDRKVDEYPGEGNGYAEVYDQAFFDKVYGLLDRAAQKTADAPAKYAARVAFVRVGLDYTKIMADLRQYMTRVIDSKGRDKEADQAARAQWDQIEALKEAHPAALNWRIIVPGSRSMRRGGGMHPDYVGRR